MADALKFLTKAPVPLRVYPAPEEFSESPVDEVHRAIRQIDAANWAANGMHAFGDHYSLILTVEEIAQSLNSLTSALVRKDMTLTLRDADPLGVIDFVTFQEAEYKFSEYQLALSGSFSPSKKLTDIWTSSLSAMAKDVGKTIRVGADFEAAQEFSKTLNALLGTIAQQLRYESPSDVSLTKGQRFTPAYQIQLCDAFLIVPDQAADFLGLLFAELSAAIRAGCTLNGDWGDLRVSAVGELYYRLSPPDFVVDRNFVESEEVE